MIKRDKPTIFLAGTALALGLAAGALFDAGLPGSGTASAILAFVAFIGIAAVNDAG
jgi:hypothetical protein